MVTPKLYILAGANGSGKSTISKVLLPTDSGLGYLAVLQKAKVFGYETLICYTFVDSPEVCIARIENRVKNGGHFVPPEDVRRRYYRSKRNFLERYSREVDSWMLCYNGGSTIVVVAEGHKSDDALILSEELYLKFKEDL